MYETSDMRDAAPPGALAYEELVAQYTQAVAAASHNATSQQLESKKVESPPRTAAHRTHRRATLQTDRADTGKTSDIAKSVELCR